MTEEPDSDDSQNYKMECVSIGAIETNKVESFWKDFKCDLDGELDACKYYYKKGNTDATNLISQERCECSLMAFSSAESKAIADKELPKKREEAEDG